MATVRISVEAARGCGYRKEKGIYLVSGGCMADCMRLPLECEVCPTCHAGIKPSRGWTWINPSELVRGILPDDQAARLPCVNCCSADPEQMAVCEQCPVSGKLTRAGLLWVGERFYPTKQDFLREAAAMGVSRRISAVPLDFKLGETWVLFAHRKGTVDWCPECMAEGSRDSDNTDCPECEGEGRVYTPAIFHAFKPTAIEYVVTGKETEEELDALEARGFSLVKVIRNDAPMFEGEILRSWTIRYYKTGRKGVTFIDQTSVDEADPAEREKLVWELFEGFGHKRTVRTYYEEEEVLG